MVETTSPVHAVRELREELLEQIWNLSEQGGATIVALHEVADTAAVDEHLAHLTREKLVRSSADRVALTAQGHEVTRHIVRAHRLAARLLTDLLELPPSLIESQACRLEHAISPAVADSICTLLGHPPTAPDGRPIPPGRCCETLLQESAPAVHPLLDLEVGASGRVTFVHPRVTQRLEQLSALGLVPGTDIHLRQRYPSVVVDLGETTLALDNDVARDIFVKRTA